jgi:hypothetical protein
MCSSVSYSVGLSSSTIFYPSSVVTLGYSNVFATFSSSVCNFSFVSSSIGSSSGFTYDPVGSYLSTEIQQETSDGKYIKITRQEEIYLKMYFGKPLKELSKSELDQELMIVRI